MEKSICTEERGGIPAEQEFTYRPCMLKLSTVNGVEIIICQKLHCEIDFETNMVLFAFSVSYPSVLCV